MKTRAGRAAGRVRRRGRGPALARRAGRAARPRRAGRAPTSVLVLDWVDEGRRGDTAAFGAGLAEVHAAGADDWGATPTPAPAARARPATARRGDPRRPATRARPARAPPAGTLHARPRGSARCSSPTTPARTGPRSTRRDGCSRSLPRAGLSARGQPSGRVGLRPDRGARRPARTALAPARRPLERQRPLGPGRSWLADRSRGLRRPPRGGPRDAAALRRPGSRSSSPPTRIAIRSRRAGTTASALYQLFPLLVHAVLFGGGYPASVERVAAKL